MAETNHSSNFFAPPCGINCKECPVYLREKNPCQGAEIGCRNRKCKGIYICCIEKKGLDFCYECSSFPCSRFRKFAETWKKYGQDLIENQKLIEKLGAKKFFEELNPPK